MIYFWIAILYPETDALALVSSETARRIVRVYIYNVNLCHPNTGLHHLLNQEIRIQRAAHAPTLWTREGPMFNLHCGVSESILVTLRRYRLNSTELQYMKHAIARYVARGARISYWCKSEYDGVQRAGVLIESGRIAGYWTQAVV